MPRLEILGGGYSKVVRSPEEKKRLHAPMSEDRVRKLLASIPSQIVIDEITETYLKAKKAKRS